MGGMTMRFFTRNLPRANVMGSSNFKIFSSFPYPATGSLPQHAFHVNSFPQRLQFFLRRNDGRRNVGGNDDLKPRVLDHLFDCYAGVQSLEAHSLTGLVKIKNTERSNA